MATWGAPARVRTASFDTDGTEEELPGLAYCHCASARPKREGALGPAKEFRIVLREGSAGRQGSPARICPRSVGPLCKKGLSAASRAANGGQIGGHCRECLRAAGQTL